MAELKTAREIFSEVCRADGMKETADGWRIAKLRDNDGMKFWGGVRCCNGVYGVLVESTEQTLRKRIQQTETMWDDGVARLTGAVQRKFRRNLKSIRSLVRIAVHQAGVTKGKRTLVADVVRKIQNEIVDENTLTTMNNTAFVEAVEKFGTVLD